MRQHESQMQLLRIIGEQLARIMELEEGLAFAEQRFHDLAKQGSLPHIKRQEGNGMYFCETCDTTFIRPGTLIERHGFEEPPFEKLACCPRCNSTELRMTERGKRYAK